MALIPCPECGKMISNQAPSCPACGFPISQYVQQKSTLLQFGRYPQGGERIEWRVLERVDGRVYLISDKCVDFMFTTLIRKTPFHGNVASCDSGLTQRFWKLHFLRKKNDTCLYLRLMRIAELEMVFRCCQVSKQNTISQTKIQGWYVQRIMLIQESKKAKAKRQVLHGGHEGRILQVKLFCQVVNWL